MDGTAAAADRSTVVEARGERIPSLGLGTWQLVGEECVTAVRDALELGYRHIDTAQAYENEEEVGRGLAASGVPRDEVFLTTKVWWENLGADQCLASIRESLAGLDTGYVDLLLIHWPNPRLVLEDVLRALDRVRENGVARHIGVSNFTPSMLRRALDTAPILGIQVEYHPYFGQARLLEIVEAENLLLTAYSPLARGSVNDDPTLREIAERHGKTPSQVTLRWLVQQERVAAIPKAASREHRRENFEIFDFELTADEMERIFALDRGERLIDPSFAPDWEE